MAVRKKTGWELLRQPFAKSYLLGLARTKGKWNRESLCVPHMLPQFMYRMGGEGITTCHRLNLQSRGCFESYTNRFVEFSSLSITSTNSLSCPSKRFTVVLKLFFWPLPQIYFSVKDVNPTLQHLAAQSLLHNSSHLLFSPPTSGTSSLNMDMVPPLSHFFFISYLFHKAFVVIL